MGTLDLLEHRDERALEQFGAWFESEYDRLALKAERAVPVSPATDPDAEARRVIARACLEYEAAFAPALLSHDARARKDEILALLVLKLARVYGREFATPRDARGAAVRLMAQTMDEGKVKTALGSAGAFVAPLLSPGIGKRAWRIFKRVPFWAKLVVGGAVVTALVAAPMVTPLSLGVVAREEFDATGTAHAPREIVTVEDTSTP